MPIALARLPLLVILPYMNPNARETPEQYAYRKCNEAIIQVKAQRTELQELLKQALADNTPIWFARVKQALKENRIKLNQLCARRSNLRKKLAAGQNSGGLLKQPIR